MKKSLSEMSLQELWELFPIRLTAYQQCWKGWFEQEREALTGSLQETGLVRLSHIGSTAVAGIWAKPIIDILAEFNAAGETERIQAALKANGYRCMSRGSGRASFNKGYTEEGFAERVFHLHVRPAGDCDELYFRDYLQAHPAAAKEYERLKLSLWRDFEHDRDGYTDAKADFVREYTEKAKLAYPGRYAYKAD
ncbi:MAG: GrpB family protein [Provencibacterium sp.]|jgi:GrpB-like predicted nucleotidyltransferase (UPF0157 family)|nr:GrpB family protein [Provencibacterium sp.]